MEKKIMLAIEKDVKVLSRKEASQLIGGDSNCSVRCNQHTSMPVEVPNCERETVIAICGGDLSQTVCTCVGHGSIE